MASIRKRPRKDGSTTFAVLYTLDGAQSSLPFDDKKAADAFKALVDNVGPGRALEIHGIDPAPRRRRASRPTTGMTVAEWITHHIDHLTGVEQYTIDKYRGYLRRDIANPLGAIPLAALTEEDIANWVKRLETTGGRSGDGNAPKTIKNKHGFLSGALAAAVPKHIPANPAAGRRLPRGDGGEDGDEMRMLSHAEFALLLSKVTEPWRPLIEFLVASGCRWGEAAALKPTDVDRDAGTVRIRRAWKKSSKGHHIGPTKTDRSKRTIDVDASVLDKLDYSHGWLFTNSGRGKGQFAAGVVTADDDPVRYSNFRRNVWDPAVNRSGLDPKPTPHDLRHTCASWMLNGGVPIPVVSRHLGHESIQVTVDVYGEVDRSSAKAAAAVIRAALD